MLHKGRTRGRTVTCRSPNGLLWDHSFYPGMELIPLWSFMFWLLEEEETCSQQPICSGRNSNPMKYIPSCYHSYQHCLDCFFEGEGVCSNRACISNCTVFKGKSPESCFFWSKKKQAKYFFQRTVKQLLHRKNVHNFLNSQQFCQPCLRTLGKRHARVAVQNVVHLPRNVGKSPKAGRMQQI